MLDLTAWNTWGGSAHELGLGFLASEKIQSLHSQAWTLKLRHRPSAYFCLGVLEQITAFYEAEAVPLPNSNVGHCSTACQPVRLGGVLRIYLFQGTWWEG